MMEAPSKVALEQLKELKIKEDLWNKYILLEAVFGA
jgi:hypothetical protein